ncbi:MAG: pyridoxamine 5'-phosphate oxidase [Paracoccaceae bacterium]
MADRTGIFAGEDPFVLARLWLAEAQDSEPNDPNACSLATVDTQGLPDVRMVLLKEIQDDGFVFYTNYSSRKGQELDSSGKAAINFHWKSLRRQIRVRGLVQRTDDATSDAYYATRPLGSRIGAWASKQSAPLKVKSELVKAVASTTAKHGTNPKRPAHWGGYKISPLEMEFWADGAFRLHDRFRWSRENDANTWQIQRLFP